MEGQNCSNYMEIKLQGDKTTRKLHGILLKQLHGDETTERQNYS